MASQFIIDDVDNPLKTTSSNPMGSADFKKVPSNFTAEELNSFTNLWLDYSQISLTIPYIQSILVNATQGFSQNQAALFTAILDKEPLLVAHFQTRKLAVLGLDWTITGGSEAKQEMLKKTLEDAGLNKLMDHLLSALQYGYAGAAINWGAGGGKIRDFRYIDPVNWTFDKRGNVALWTAKGEQTVLTAENAAQFVFHAYNPKPGIPSTGGLLRSLVWTYFFKHTAVKHQARFLEKFGIPFLITQISENDFRDDTIRNKIKNELRSIGADGAGVVTQQAKVDTLNATTQQANFLGWIKYNDDAYAISILGQLASSSAGGGFSKDQIQENVRRDIMESDAKSLADTISSQILKPLEMFKFGTHECKFEIDYKPALDVAEKVKTIQALNAVGLKAQKQWIEDTVGVPLESEEEKPSGKALPELPAPAKAVPGLPMTPSPTDLLGGAQTSAPSSAPPPAPAEAPAESAEPEAMNDSGSKKNLIAFADGWSPVHEFEFRNWYSQYAAENNVNPDPDAEGLGKENRELWNQSAIPEDYLVQSGIPQYQTPGTEEQIPDTSALDADDNNEYLRQLMAELEDKAKVSAVGKLADASEQQVYSYFESAWNKLPARVQDSFDKRKLYDKFRDMRFMYMSDPQTTFEKVADSAQFQLSPTERTTWQKNGEAFLRGMEDFASSLTGIADMTLGGTDPKIRDFNKKFQQYRTQEDKEDAVKGEDWLSDAWYSTVRMVPNAVGILGTSLLTGGFGSAPTLAAALGAKGLAKVALGAVPSYLQGAGDIYNTIVGTGVDRDIATLASLAGAVPYAALEQSQFGKMLGKYAPDFLPYKEVLKTGAGKAVSDAVKKYGADKVEKSLGQFWKNSVLKPGANFAIDVGKEAGQEVLQDIVSTMSEVGSVYVNDVLRGSNLMEEQPELADRLKQFGNTFVQSIGPMFLMTLGGRVGGKVYTETIDKQRKAKAEADKAYELSPERFVTRLSVEDGRTPEQVAEGYPIEDLGKSPEFLQFLKEHKNVREALDSGYLSYKYQDSEKMGDNAGQIRVIDGAYQIWINKDFVKTPEKFLEVFGHEDFGHRFMYGNNDAISAERRARVESVVDKISQDSSWWGPDLDEIYQKFYEDQNVPADKIKNLILEEKVARFFEVEAWKRLPKDSAVRSFMSEVVLWFKETFPKVFGELSENDVLQILSNTYRKYKKNSITSLEKSKGGRAKHMATSEYDKAIQDSPTLADIPDTAIRAALERKEEPLTGKAKKVLSFKQWLRDRLKVEDLGVQKEAKSEKERQKDKNDIKKIAISILRDKSKEGVPVDERVVEKLRNKIDTLSRTVKDVDEFDFRVFTATQEALKELFANAGTDKSKVLISLKKLRETYDKGEVWGVQQGEKRIEARQLSRKESQKIGEDLIKESAQFAGIDKSQVDAILAEYNKTASNLALKIKDEQLYQTKLLDLISEIEDRLIEEAGLDKTKHLVTTRYLRDTHKKGEVWGVQQERDLVKLKNTLVEEALVFLRDENAVPPELTNSFQKDARTLVSKKETADEFVDSLGELTAEYLDRIDKVKSGREKDVIRKAESFQSAEEFYNIIKPTDVSWIDLPQSEKRLYEACYSYSNRFAQTSTMDTQLEKSRYSNELLDNLAKDFAILREQYAEFGTMADAVQANIANYLTQSAQLFENNAAGFNELNKTLSAAREITDEKKRLNRLFQIYKAIDTRLNLWTKEAQDKFTKMLDTQKEKLADKLEKIKIPAYPENFEGLTSEEQMLAFLQRYSTQSVQSREQLLIEYNKYLAHPEEMTGFDSKTAEIELAKTPVYQMDMTKLPDAMFDLQSLAKEERILRQERKRFSDEYLSETVAKSIQDIVDTHGRPNKPIESPWQNIKDVFQKTFNLVLMPDQIPNWLVGFKESPLVQVTYENLVQSLIGRNSLEHLFMGKLEPMLKEAGISRHVYQSDIELQGEKFTISQILGIYAWSLNDKSKSHLLGTFGDKLDPLLKDIEQLFKTEKYTRYQKLVNGVISFYGETVYPEVDKLYYRLHGVHLPKEDNYFPINSLDYMIVNKKTAFEMFAENFSQKGIQRPLDGFTKERSLDSKIPFKDLDFFKAMSTNIGDVTNFVCMYESVDFARRFLNNNEIRDTINRINPIWYEKLVDQVNTFANSKPGHDSISRACDIIRANMGAAILGANTTTVMMQPAAIFPGIVDVALKNPRALISAVKEMTGMSLRRGQHSIEILNETINKLDPYMATRQSRYGQNLSHWINTALSTELKGLNLALTTAEDIKQWSFVGLQSMDNVCSYYVWNANYKAALMEGKSQEEAIKIARDMVIKTQQVNDPALMPSLFTNNFTKVFAQFQLPVCQIINMVVRDWMKFGYNARELGLSAQPTQAALKKAAAQLVFGFTTTALVTYLIRGAFEDLLDSNEDAEKKFKKMALGTVSESFQMMASPLAIFGPSLADQIQASSDELRRSWLKEPVTVRRVDGVAPPAFSMMWQLVAGFAKSAQSIGKFGIEGAWDRGELTNFDMYRGVMGAAGLPFIGPSRIYRQWGKFEKYGDPRYLMFGSSKLDSKYPISQGLAYEIPEYDKKMEEQGLGFRFTAPSKIVSYKVSSKLETWFVLDDADYETYWNLATEYFKASYSPYKPQYDEKEMKKAWSDAKKRAKDALSGTWKIKYADAFTRNLKGFSDMSTMSFAELTAEELKKKGTDLIRLLQGITSAKARAAVLKEEIMPYAANQPVETDEGTIVYVEGSEGQVMNRTVLRNKMVDMFKIDPARAEALLNSASAKKLIDAYLKVMKKKTPVVAKEIAPATEEKKETPNA